VRAARELGYKVMLTDRNPACYCADKAERFIELSTFDVAGHVLLARVNSDDLAAVFTAGADPIVTVARAVEAAGCHGVPVGIAETCASKVQVRLALQNEDVPQPAFTQVSGNDLFFVVDQFINIGGVNSVIVKAMDSSGSRGHTRISQLEDIDWNAIYQKAIQYSSGSRVLVEGWLDGMVLSVETLWYNGVMIPLNAVERPFDGIIELGHYNPLVTDAETYAGGHIFKGDLIITDDGPKVLELTTRLSGGFDSGWTSPMAHGTNYTKGALLLALGRPLEEAMPYFTPRWHRHAACIAVFGPKEGGVIKEIRGLEKAKEYAEIICLYQEGDQLPALTDCTQRVCFCIAADENDMESKEETLTAHEFIEVICE
jgi:biotin carboxylase